MKKKLFFMPLLAALTFFGCTNDESADNGQDDDKEVNYIAVNIMAPNNAIGRAATEGGFEEPGTENAAENTVSSALFLFFDADGNATQAPQEQSLTWTDETSNNPHTEKISEATVVITGKTKPTQMLVILNPSQTIITYANGKSLNEIKTRQYTYDLENQNNKFVMTNSVYVNDNEICCATPIPADQVYETKDAAINGEAIDVYVERILAKVNTINPSEGIAITPKTIDLFNNDQITIVQDIKGIEIANIIGSSYTTKNITNWTTWPDQSSTDSWKWNDPDNKRCYWAESPSANIIYKNKNYSDITDDPKKSQSYYVQENTNGQKTSVLVTAVIKKEGETKGLDLVRWSGNYFLKDDFLKQYAHLLNNKGVRVRDRKDGSLTSMRSLNITDDEDSELLWLTPEEHTQYVNNGKLQSYEMTAKVNWNKFTNSDLEIGILNDENELEIDQTGVKINNLLCEEDMRCWLWEGGMCYYFAEIEHFGPALSGGIDFSKGIVRNHVYNLTLESLTGLGTPVYNPDEIIIPEKPEDELFYLAAKINILKWKVVNQKVKFE